MSAPQSQDWQRVARFVTQRRRELGLKQVATPGVSPATWTKLEGAKQDRYKPFLLANVERVLGWPVGTIERIAEGEEPPCGTAEGDDLTGRVRKLEETVRRLLDRLDEMDT